MNPWLTMILMALYLGATFAVCDHGAGGGFDWSELKRTKYGKFFPGRPLYYYGIAAIISVLFFQRLEVGLGLAGAAFAWIIYRSFSWRLFGGSTTPSSYQQDVGFFFRNLLAIIAIVPLAIAHLSWKNFGFAAIVYAGVAVYLGNMLYHASKNGKDITKTVELVRGFTFGLALTTSLLPSVV